MKELKKISAGITILMALFLSTELVYAGNQDPGASSAKSKQPRELSLKEIFDNAEFAPDPRVGTKEFDLGDDNPLSHPSKSYPKPEVQEPKVTIFSPEPPKSVSETTGGGFVMQTDVKTVVSSPKPASGAKPKLEKPKFTIFPPEPPKSVSETTGGGFVLKTDVKTVVSSPKPAPGAKPKLEKPKFTIFPPEPTKSVEEVTGGGFVMKTEVKTVVSSPKPVSGAKPKLEKPKVTIFSPEPPKSVSETPGGGFVLKTEVTKTVAPSPTPKPAVNK